MNGIKYYYIVATLPTTLVLTNVLSPRDATGPQIHSPPFFFSFFFFNVYSLATQNINNKYIYFPFFQLKKNVLTAALNSRRGGGRVKALMARPLKKVFCGFPNAPSMVIAPSSKPGNLIG